MFINFKQRFIIYPAIWLTIFTIAFTKFSSSTIVKEVENMFILPLFEAVGLNVSFYVFIGIFSILFGYVYGTISQVVKTRNFSGITMLAVFIIKFFLSSMGIVFGIFAFVIELILFPFVLIAKRKYIKKKEEKKNEKLMGQFREIIREEHNKYMSDNQQDQPINSINNTEIRKG